MEISVWNPLKGRLQTIDIEFTEENTTWFDDATNDQDIHMITDTESGLLISEIGYYYPVLIEGETRADIDHDMRKAWTIRDTYCQFY